MSKVVCEVSRWRFLAGGCSAVGKPAEVDSDQTETLTENGQHSPTWEIADILNMSRSEVISEKEKCVLFYGKSHMDFSASAVRVGRVDGGGRARAVERRGPAIPPVLPERLPCKDRVRWSGPQHLSLWTVTVPFTKERGEISLSKRGFGFHFTPYDGPAAVFV